MSPAGGHRDRRAVRPRGPELVFDLQPQEGRAQWGEACSRGSSGSGGPFLLEAAGGRDDAAVCGVAQAQA